MSPRPGATVEQWHAGMDELSRLVALAETAAERPIWRDVLAAEARAVAAEAERDAARNLAGFYAQMCDKWQAEAGRLGEAEDAAEAEAAMLRDQYVVLDAWVSRMPNAGFNTTDPRWSWWHSRPLAAAGREGTE